MGDIKEIAFKLDMEKVVGLLEGKRLVFRTEEMIVTIHPPLGKVVLDYEDYKAMRRAISSEAAWTVLTNPHNGDEIAELSLTDCFLPEEFKNVSKVRNERIKALKAKNKQLFNELRAIKENGGFKQSEDK